MLEQYYYLGDCSRIQNLYQNAEKYKPLSLVFLGASVTMAYLIEPQHQFLTAIQQYLERTHHAVHPTIHNLGTPGMTSLHGLYQSYTELEEKKPDLIVIDYAVNDQKNATCRDSYEALLVRCLSLPSKPAVISFFVQTLDGYTCAPQMAAVNEYYGVPYVNIGGQIQEDIRKGKFRWENYSYDDRHPGPFGHTWIGKCLTEFLAAAEHAPACYFSYPAKSFYDRSLADMDFFPVHWENTPQSLAAPLVRTVRGQKIFLAYDVGISLDYGNLQIEIDDEPPRIIESYRIHEWNHIHEDVLYCSRTPGEHKLCIRMQPGNEEKYFHLHALGFA